MGESTNDELRLHFLLLDLLGKGDMYTINGMCEEIEESYENIEKKVKNYTKQGILTAVKDEGSTYYYVSGDNAVNMADEYEGLADAVEFYSRVDLFGEIGTILLKQMNLYEIDTTNDELDILLRTRDRAENSDNLLKSRKIDTVYDIVEAIRLKKTIEVIDVEDKSKHCVTPLKIYLSAVSDKVWIIGMDDGDRLIKAYEIGRYSYSKTLKKNEEADKIKEDFCENKENNIWDVDGVIDSNYKSQVLKVIINIEEYYEQSIINRINREGRHGKLERIGNNTYSFTINICRCAEVINWIRTFTGRIVMIECEDKAIVRSFYSDIEKMYKMYNQSDDKKYEE